MAQSRLLNELKSLLLELRSVPWAGRLTHPKVHMRVTKSGRLRKPLFGLVHSRQSRPLFSPLWCLQALAIGLAGATLTLRLKFARLRGATRGIQLALIAAR